MIAHTADNANVNYGSHHSVFKNFQEESQFIVKANCNCHIIQNTAEHALIQLPLDVENLIIKVYLHFSMSAKRVDSLKSCYEYSEKWIWKNFKICTYTLALSIPCNQALSRQFPLKYILLESVVLTVHKLSMTSFGEKLTIIWLKLMCILLIIWWNYSIKTLNLFRKIK